MMLTSTTTAQTVLILTNHKMCASVTTFSNNSSDSWESDRVSMKQRVQSSCLELGAATESWPVQERTHARSRERGAGM